jgi:hypothetical protein
MRTKEDEELPPVDWLLSNFKNKLKLLFRKFRLLFKNEWTWRLFLVLQVVGLIGIIYLAITNDNHWHLLPYTSILDNELTWDFFGSSFWTYHHENWFATAFFVGPFLLSKAMDWIFAAKKKSPPADDWKQN